MCPWGLAEAVAALTCRASPGAKESYNVPAPCRMPSVPSDLACDVALELEHFGDDYGLQLAEMDVWMKWIEDEHATQDDKYIVEHGLHAQETSRT